MVGQLALSRDGRSDEKGVRCSSVPSSAELSLSSCRTSSSLERLESMSSSESMLVEAVVTGVGGEPWVGWAAAAEVLLLGRRSLVVEDNFASAAFLLRDLGGMVMGDSEAKTRVLLLRGWVIVGS